MEKISRLFDFLTHQRQQMPKDDMLCSKDGADWKKWSTEEVYQTAKRLASGLLKLGFGTITSEVEEKDKIAVVSKNCPEWMLLDLACQQIGVVLCPIYPTTHSDEIQFIFNDAQIKAVFVYGDELFDKLKLVQAQVPTLQHLFRFDISDGSSSSWHTLLEHTDSSMLDKVNYRASQINPEDCVTIIYTSGTTGTPKGVMLSHRNIVSNVMNATASFPFPPMPQARALSFLPLNHIFERVATYIYMYAGISVYYAESMETIGDNLREVQPTLFTTVPRLLEKVYEKIMNNADELPGWKKQLFFWAVGLGKQYDLDIKRYSPYQLKVRLARALVFKKWQAALGGRVKYIITGGAACPIHLLRIFNAAGIPVYEGYGPTENSPVISVNCAKPGGTRFGTAGLVIQGQDVKLLEDGEICVKGPSVMMGYYKRPDLTKEVLIDGWLHTGDIGAFNDSGHLIITDRKKELFKTSGGKYVAPQVIENKLKASPFIEQAMVIGEGKKFVSALIVPNQAYLNKKVAQHTSIELGFGAYNHPIAQQLLEEAVAKVNDTLNPVEQIKKFVLLHKEWSVDSGELTPKMSLRRKIILAKFHEEIERLYST